MTLEEFKILHYKFSKLPLPRKVWDTPEHELYIEAVHNNKEFHDWTLVDKFKKTGFDYSEFCCLNLAEKVFDSVDERGELDLDNVNVIMRKWKDGTYGIPIHDGGSSIIEIAFCPWCGSELKKASS